MFFYVCLEFRSHELATRKRYVRLVESVRDNSGEVKYVALSFRQKSFVKESETKNLWPQIDFFYTNKK